MNKTITHLEFVFENVQILRIDIEHVSTFIMKGVSEQRYLFNNKYEKKNIVDETFIRLHHTADHLAREVTFVDMDESYDSLFERLRGARDLVYLVIMFDDGTDEKLFMNWDLFSDQYDNVNQKVYDETIDDNTYCTIHIKNQN